ncbi:probable ATP-dependent RNA helicase Dbp73D [Anopheles maculipalpis]|uniref:probable ATP-dependent RNA helicase Dbp73D n=1 Tax=Anopheles maculipalpis TaxID=1496333 RepID=UPI0021594638|nr:probable ATP-dependent RNA helicase Dbp73D [Anopheles maculipalpis]
MELFAVNRYDTTKLNADDERAQEEIILQKLQARKEKKARLSASQTRLSPENQVQQIQPPEGLVNDEGAKLETEQEEKLEPELPQTEVAGKQHETPVKDDKEHHKQSIVDSGDKQMGDFIVLGGDKLHRLKQTDEVLPPWLSHPTIIVRELSSKGPSIKKQPYLDDAIKSNLKRMGYKRLFPVQEKVIPWILEAHGKPAPFWPRDVCISSPTGSGKTLAFAVPVVQLLMHRVAPAVRALVILPVQELAEQVFQVFRKMCEGTTISPVVLSRGIPLEAEQKKLVKYCNGAYVSKVDIVVTTAGRLIEHLHSTKGFTLRHLRFLIVDEADKVMNQIQNDWLYHLNKHVKQESDEYLLGRSSELLSQAELFDRPRQPHKLLFSATFKRDAEKLKTLKLFHPKLFTAVMDPQERTIMAQHTAAQQQQEPRRGKFAGQYTTPLELKEFVCLTDQRNKPLTLYGLIRENGYRKFLVFTNGISSSHRLSFVLQRLFGTEMVIEEWSSSLSPATRRNVLSRFSMGKVNGIICTDALARGIDIESIEVVISYDMPNHVDKYIHRIGRTARAGYSGTAITLVTEDERKKFKSILKEADKKELEAIEVSPSTEEQYAAQYASALNDLREALALETEVINKLRNGVTIGNMTRVNLLTKLKDQVDITYSTEIIKSLKLLPKSWTNEAIELKAQAGRKRKEEAPAAGEDVVNAKRAKVNDESGKMVNGNAKKLSGEKRKLTNGNDSTAETPITEPPVSGDRKNTTKANKKRKGRKRKSASSGMLAAAVKLLPNGTSTKGSEKKGESKKLKRVRIKRKLHSDGKVTKNRWRRNGAQTETVQHKVAADE